MSGSATLAGASAESAIERRNRSFRIGLVLAALNIIIGAAYAALTRWGATNLDPLLFCTGAVVVAAICSVSFMYWRGELPLLFGRRFRGRLATVAMVGTFTTSLLVTFGLTRISAIAATILLQIEPVYSLILAVVVVGERPSHRQLIATATILIGIGSVLGAGGSFSPLWAAMLVFLTPLFWQISHVMGLRVMPPLTPLAVTAGRMVYGATGLTILLLLLRPTAIGQLANPTALVAVIAAGTFIYFLSALTWYGAISRLSLAWTTALVVPANPLLSILFAVMFLGERATGHEIIGVLIAIAGVLFLVLGADAHRTLPDSEAAEAIHQPLA